MGADIKLEHRNMHATLRSDGSSDLPVRTAQLLIIFVRSYLLQCIFHLNTQYLTCSTPLPLGVCVLHYRIRSYPGSFHPRELLRGDRVALGPKGHRGRAGGQISVPGQLPYAGLGGLVLWYDPWHSFYPICIMITSWFHTDYSSIFIDIVDFTVLYICNILTVTCI